MTPSHTRKNGRLYRYYVSVKVLKFGAEACPVKRIAADEIESAVVGQIRALIQTPQIIVATWRKARASLSRLTEDDVRTAFERFDSLWNELFHAEQARIVQLLVERIDIQPDAAEITLKTEGLIGLVSELGLASKPAKEAA